MFNLIVANIHNTKTDRYHPVLFYESTLPGPPSESKPVRHKSKGHHTEGFDTRKEAIASCEDIAKSLEQQNGVAPRTCLEKDFAWDGEDTPAMVIFFDMIMPKEPAVITAK